MKSLSLLLIIICSIVAQSTEPTYEQYREYDSLRVRVSEFSQPVYPFVVDTHSIYLSNWLLNPDAQIYIAENAEGVETLPRRRRNRGDFDPEMIRTEPIEFSYEAIRLYERNLREKYRIQLDDSITEESSSSYLQYLNRTVITDLTFNNFRKNSLPWRVNIHSGLSVDELIYRANENNTIKSRELFLESKRQDRQSTFFAVGGGVVAGTGLLMSLFSILGNGMGESEINPATAWGGVALMVGGGVSWGFSVGKMSKSTKLYYDGIKSYDAELREQYGIEPFTYE